MTKQYIILLMSLLLLSSFTIAGHTHDDYRNYDRYHEHDRYRYDDYYDRYDSDRDYYWAKEYQWEYYRSSRYDHDRYYDHDYDRFDGRDRRYDDARFYYAYRHHDAHDTDRYRYRYYDLDDRQYEGRVAIPEPDMYFDRHDYKLQYSPVYDKYYLTKCYVYPPKDPLIYVKC